MKNSFFSSKVLDIIARCIENEFTDDEIKRILRWAEIPESIIILRDAEVKSILNIFNSFQSQKGGEKMISSIIEEFLDPLSNEGNENKSMMLAQKLQNVLRFESIYIFHEGPGYRVLNEMAYEEAVTKGAQEAWEETRESLFMENHNRSIRDKTQKQTVDLLLKNVNHNLQQEYSINIIDDIGFLQLDNKKIKIGPTKNVPFKLLQALHPLGEIKAINKVFNESVTDQSKYRNEELTFDYKKNILRNRIKELQPLFKSNKVRVKLIFPLNDETVYLKIRY
jgi:hypothetical protein